MRDSINALLMSNLLRVLELAPSLKVADAVERVLQTVKGIDTLTAGSDIVERYLTEAGKNLRQRAVINPNWLSQARNVRFHFYLVDATAGWLDHLFQQTEALQSGVSHYILYGRWDSLIVLLGNDDEANEFLRTVGSIQTYEVVPFASRSVPLFHRYKPDTPSDCRESLELTIVNRLVQNYATPGLDSERLELERGNVILGPAWQFESLPEPTISAFVGVTFTRGGRAPSPDEVLSVLLADDSVGRCLVHLFQIEMGLPFHYMAKLTCQNMGELDRATNAIGFTTIGRTGLEGDTFAVASGRERFPTVRSERITGIGPVPRVGDIEHLVKKATSGLGSDAITAFNALDGIRQFRFVVSLDELDRQADDRSWDDDRERAIRSAIDLFARITLTGGDTVNLTGAVMQIATAVEGYVKHALRRIGEAVCGRDYGLMQRELKLPSKDLRRISLGRAAVAFRTAKDGPAFAFLVPVLTDDRLDRLTRFADLRNKWAHGEGRALVSWERAVDEGTRALVEGIEIIRWIGSSVLPGLADSPSIVSGVTEMSLPAKRGSRGPGIFISYSSPDKAVARSLAVMLDQLGYSVWYDDWAIGPGDSIVGKISEGLARKDMLIVLLSPSSVRSLWVRRELNTALMSQLSGQAVKVVPVMTKKCSIPTILKDIKYIDMTQGLQKGFVQLLEFLGK